MTRSPHGSAYRSVPPMTAEKQSAELGERGGVVVTQVQEGSFAEEIGLQERDIIVSINRQPVGAADDVRNLQTKTEGRRRGGVSACFDPRRGVRTAEEIGTAAPAAQYLGQYIAGTLPAE